MTGRTLRRLLLFLICFFSSVILQSSVIASDVTENDYKNFRQAERSLQRGDNDSYLNFLLSQRESILYPYYHYRYLRSKFSQIDPAQVDNFLKLYKDSAIADQLKKEWLIYLAKKQQWQEFIRFYSDTKNTTVRCYHAEALYHTGNKQKAFKEAKVLWLVAHPQNKTCDAVFALWKKSNSFSGKLVLQRMSMALDKREVKLAKSLVSQLHGPQRATANFWLKIYSNPRYVRKRFLADNALTRRQVANAIRKLARRSFADATKSWDIVQKHYQFTKAEKQYVLRFFSINFALRKNPKADYWADKIDLPTSPQAHEWAIRSALYHKQWPRVKALIEQMPDDKSTQPIWQYWYARALEAVGLHKQANTKYEYLAKQRHFYGLMSADRLDKKFQVNHRSFDVGRRTIDRVHQDPGMKRTRALYLIKKKGLSRKEWFKTLSRYSPEEMHVAAYLAASWGWYELAIRAAYASEHRDDMYLRFPILHKELVHKTAKTHNIPPELIHAVIRQESACMERAQSPAGALGLMQLMPKTARLVAGKKKIRIKNHNDIMNIKNNITLGSAYLQQLKKKFSGNIVYAIASYNAGHKNVNRWIKKGKNIDMDIWIENIPWAETRWYVKQVLTYREIYKFRLASPQVVNVDD